MRELKSALEFLCVGMVFGSSLFLFLIGATRIGIFYFIVSMIMLTLAIKNLES